MKNKVFRLLALVLTIIMVIPFGIGNAFAEDEIEGTEIESVEEIQEDGTEDVQE